MTNPKQYGKRQASIWFDTDEYTAVEDKAKALGMKFSEYVRFSALNANVQVAVKEKNKKVLKEGRK